LLQRTETLNSLVLKIKTHNVAKCLGDNYSDQMRSNCRNNPRK